MENLAEAQKRIDYCRTAKATTLDLSGLRLTRMPYEVFSLTDLTELYLGRWNASGESDNRITELPSAIENLQNLRRLDLSNNQLSTLPEAITRLQNLNVLDLSNNQLSILPEEVTCLQNLNELYLIGNRLSTLSESVTCLQNLSVLGLNSNLGGRSSWSTVKRV